MLEMLDTGIYTLQQVGDQFGLTRERVRQIYRKKRGKGYFLHDKWTAEHLTLCPVCGKSAQCKGYCGWHYTKMRYHLDSVFRVARNKATVKWHRKKYQIDPVWRAKQLAYHKQWLAKRRQNNLEM